MNIKSFFIQKNSFYEVNHNNILALKERREKVYFLFKVIIFWKETVDVFCYTESIKKRDDEVFSLSEDEWVFKYNSVAVCRRCKRAQDVLNKIFGNCSSFNDLPFVFGLGNNFYFFTFKLMKFFLDNKSDSFLMKKAEEEYQKWLVL